MKKKMSLDKGKEINSPNKNVQVHTGAAAIRAEGSAAPKIVMQK